MLIGLSVELHGTGDLFTLVGDAVVVCVSETPQIR